MSAELHILVVDDRPDSVLFMTEFLRSRGQRVETTTNGVEALEAVLKYHRTRETYDLVISDVAMPVMDGLGLVQELRRRQIQIPFALYTAFGAMHPTLQQQAMQHGCIAFLEKPIELRRIERLLDEVSTRRSGTGSVNNKDQPFFGTSRVARPATSTYRREPDVTAPEPDGGALERKSGAAGTTRVAPPKTGSPQTASYPPAATGQQPRTTLPDGTEPAGKYPTTSFVRRGVEPPVKATGYTRRKTETFLSDTSSLAKGQTTTSRIRRSISGTHPPIGDGAPPLPNQPAPGQAGSPSRAVQCAHCQKVFLVLVKPDIYTAMCIHCGQLNRIEPL